MPLVKRIVRIAQRIVQILDCAVWMQLLPRAGAHAAFAALEREKQGVEARRDFADRVAGDCGVGGRVEVGELVGVGLFFGRETSQPVCNYCASFGTMWSGDVGLGGGEAVVVFK